MVTILLTTVSFVLIKKTYATKHSKKQIIDQNKKSMFY